MILKKKVAQLCKRSKSILLSTAKDRTQWVGAQSAAYSLAGMPSMSIEELMVAFDYTEDEKSKFTTASVIDLGDRISDDYPEAVIGERNFSEGELDALLKSLRETADQIEDGYEPRASAKEYDEGSEQLGMEEKDE